MEIRDFFAKQFGTQGSTRPRIPPKLFSKLQASSIEFLESVPLDVDIIRAVWDCSGDKAPGPDGFNFKFIQAAWSIIGEDILLFVRNFFNTASLHKNAASSFITLIPKVAGSAKLDNYRPISLVGCLYKIVAKVMANRLKLVIKEVVGEEQSAFVSGRNIVDCIMLANEIIGYLKKATRQGILIKLDFKKAFDCLNLEYLDDTMRSMGFGPNWRKWIKGCIGNASASVLVNGSPTGIFKLHRGLRQGDPLSPFLFIIAAEGLRVMIKKSEQLGMVNGIQLPMDISHSIIQYADDTLLLSENRADSLTNLHHIVTLFGMVSGLQLNPTKTMMYSVNVPESGLVEELRIWECKWGQLPLKYLGLPVGCNMKRLHFWKPVLDAIDKRLASWKGKLLSFGGRVSLINSVLSCLPVYFLSIYKLPVGVLRAIEKKMRYFLWSGGDECRKAPRVKWELVISPKEDGGLGIENLWLKNQVLLVKWLWRFMVNKSSIWVTAIKAIHNQRDRGLFSFPTAYGDGGWARINEVAAEGDFYQTIREETRLKTGDGSKFLFWHDPWLNDTSLKEVYPRLYAISNQKNLCIADCGGRRDDNWSWSLSWSRPLRAWEEETKSSLLQNISTFRPTTDEDSLVWGLETNGIFSVKSLRQKLNIANGIGAEMAGDLRRIWSNLIPSKVECFLWVALQGRLPTRDRLIRSNRLEAWDCLCPLCGLEDESGNHLLLHCTITWKIWNHFVSKIGVSWCVGSSVGTSLSAWMGLVGGGTLNKVWFAIYGATMWGIWLLRNKAIFDDENCHRELIIHSITFHVNEWIVWAKTLKECGFQDLLLYLNSVATV